MEDPRTFGPFAVMHVATQAGMPLGLYTTGEADRTSADTPPS